MMSRRILAVGLVLAAMAPVLAQDRSEPLQLSLFSLKATAAYPLRPGITPGFEPVARLEPDRRQRGERDQ